MDIEEYEDLPRNLSEYNDTNATNLLDHDYENEMSFYVRLFLEVFTVVAMLSIAANVFITFVIIKYKRLRKEVTNILLLHMNIVEILYLLSTPMSMRIFAMFDAHISVTLFCFINELESVLLICVFLFLILLTTDWYIKTYSETKYPRFRHIYKFFVALIYILTVSVASLTTQFCLNSYYFFHFTMLIVFFFYLVMIIFVIIMNIIHRVKARRLTNKVPNNIGLAITNIFMLAWSPLLLVIVFSILGYHIVILMIMAVSVCFTSPVFNLLYLYRCDSNFNVFLKRTFRCECNDYQNEPLEDTSVTYNDVNGVQIPEQTQIA